METDTREYYGMYWNRLRQIQEEILAEINRLLASLTDDPEHALAEHILSRIKSPDSVKTKLAGKGCPLDAVTALTVLSDIIGIRIVTHFLGDVYTIMEELQKNDGWEVTTVKDYIANPKPNGYRSLHILLKVPFDEKEIPFIIMEIQMRTIAMDCWASLEHQLKYKKTISNVSLIVAELKRCADEMASTDLTMETIREMIKKS